MNIFLLDLWHDLRMKRLWPVAVALALALVAVPVVLSKPTEEPRVAKAPAARTASEPKEQKGFASVSLDESAENKGSSLDTFDPNNPFRPPSKILKRSSDGSSTKVSSTSAPAPTGGSTDTGLNGGSNTGITGGGITVGGTGGGDGGSGGTTAATYQYVADVTFTHGNRTRHIEGMKKLAILPSQASPLLIFMGVTSSANDVVFLVDSTLESAGEGRCKPSRRNCAVVSIGAGSERIFTGEDGDSYTLRIDEIRKVKVAATTTTVATPKITRVTPMRVQVGALLTIRGSGFKARRNANTVTFRGPTGRTVFVKPQRARTNKLVVRIPAAVARLLRVDGTQQKPTRLKLRVLAGRFSKFTPRRLSPVVLGSSTTAPGG